MRVLCWKHMPMTDLKYTEKWPWSSPRGRRCCESELVWSMESWEGPTRRPVWGQTSRRTGTCCAPLSRGDIKGGAALWRTPPLTSDLDRVEGADTAWWPGTVVISHYTQCGDRSELMPPWHRSSNCLWRPHSGLEDPSLAAPTTNAGKADMAAKTETTTTTKWACAQKLRGW